MRRNIAYLMALLFAMVCLSFLTAASGETVMWVRTRTGRNLNVRSEKMISADTKIGSIPDGKAVTVLSVEDGWAEIVYQPAGYSAPLSPAWVQANLLSDQAPDGYVSPENPVSLPDPLAYSSATVSELNNQFSSMRSVEAFDVIVVPDTKTGTVRLNWAPTTNSTVAAYLPAGYQVTVLASNDTWLMVHDSDSDMVGYLPVKFTGQP